MDLPSQVEINEVVLRDGLQLETKIVSTEEKKLIFDHLAEAGVKSLEFGSFVHPKLVPQMANSGELYSAISAKSEEVALIALIPNLKGAERAKAFGVKRVNFVFSASDTHNRQNVKKSTEESLEDLKAIHDFCSKQHILLTVAIATSFGCPFEGEVPVERVQYAAGKVAALGVETITLADTTGMANPKQVYDLVTVMKEKFPTQKFALHFHNTRGMGLSNILAGLQAGVTSFDASLGGIGGCPFAPGATGNVCTEDVVHMLHSMGIETGLSLEKLLKASAELKKIVEHETPSYILKAGPYNRKYPVPSS